MASKSGKKTREEMKKVATKAVAVGEEQLKELQQEIEEVLAEAKVEITILKGQAKAELSAAAKKAQVIEEKVHELLSAISSGEADDKDLQKVIDEANKVIHHLQSFFKKSSND